MTKRWSLRERNDRRRIGKRVGKELVEVENKTLFRSDVIFRAELEFTPLFSGALLC